MLAANAIKKMVLENEKSEATPAITPACNAPVAIPPGVSAGSPLPLLLHRLCRVLHLLLNKLLQHKL